MFDFGYRGLYFQYYHLNNDTWSLVRSLFYMAGYRLQIRSRNKRDLHSLVGTRYTLAETNHFVTFFSRYSSYKILSNICSDAFQEDTVLLNSFFPGLFNMLGNYSTQHELPVLPMYTTSSLITALEGITMLFAHSHSRLIVLLSYTHFVAVACLYALSTQCFLYTSINTIHTTTPHTDVNNSVQLPRAPFLKPCVPAINHNQP